ncbi:hypothetical protein OG21DRAFT_1525104 [Imleria badia]|nr:hypothetical protein OG21DRAFT_1525104 [Imleria badia]
MLLNYEPQVNCRHGAVGFHRNRGSMVLAIVYKSLVQIKHQSLLSSCSAAIPITSTSSLCPPGHLSQSQILTIEPGFATAESACFLFPLERSTNGLESERLARPESRHSRIHIPILSITSPRKKAVAYSRVADRPIINGFASYPSRSSRRQDRLPLFHILQSASRRRTRTLSRRRKKPTKPSRSTLNPGGVASVWRHVVRGRDTAPHLHLQIWLRPNRSNASLPFEANHTMLDVGGSQTVSVMVLHDNGTIRSISPSPCPNPG